jgi:hypothetical protein
LIQTIGNIILALSAGRPAPPTRGTAFTQPPSLWTTWIAYALSGVFASGWLFFGARSPLYYLFLPFLVLRVRYALFAKNAAHQWQWSSIAGIMAAKEALLAAAALLVLLTRRKGDFTPEDGMMTLILSSGLFFFASFYATSRQVTTSHAEDVGEGPDGLTSMDLATGPSMFVQSLRSWRRPTHLCGVGATGTFTCGELEALGEAGVTHDFFTAGATWPVTMRFSNVTYEDDAALDVRGAALRLALPGAKSPFDMLMNTGPHAAFTDVIEFGVIVFSKFIPEKLVMKLLPRNRKGWEGGLVGWRRAPSSYSNLQYFSAVVRHWITLDGSCRLVRYRLVPEDRTLAESGWVRGSDLGTPRARLPTETRPPDYLRQELRQRLAPERAHVNFSFEVQIHTPQQGDGLTWYDAALEWPVNTHPWMPLATVSLDATLPFEDTERLEFGAINHPPSLPVPLATGPRDPRSLADSERRVIAVAQALRRWQRRVRGLPDPIGKMS